MLHFNGGHPTTFTGDHPTNVQVGPMP
jgi:hypothetical protein